MPPEQTQVEVAPPDPESAYSLGFAPTAKNEAIQCACWPTYATKKAIKTLKEPHGVCYAPNGEYAIVYWSVEKKFSVYDKKRCS